MLYFPTHTRLRRTPSYIRGRIIPEHLKLSSFSKGDERQSLGGSSTHMLQFLTPTRLRRTPSYLRGRIFHTTTHQRLKLSSFSKRDERQSLGGSSTHTLQFLPISIQNCPSLRRGTSEAEGVFTITCYSILTPTQPPQNKTVGKHLSPTVSYRLS